MYLVLVVLSGLVSILLMVIVLMQSSKGGGLAGTFGGANMGSMFGTRRTADFLSKATWWLGGIMAALALITNLFFLPGASTVSQQQSIIQQSGQQQTLPPNASLPQQQLPPQQTQSNQQNQNTQQNPKK